MNAALIFFSLLVFQLSAQALPAFDRDFSCTTEAKSQQYVRDFKIDSASFGGKELCNGTTDFKKLMNDLEIIEQGQFTTSGSNNLIRGFIDQSNYYRWMIGETRGMNRGNDVPYATAYNSWGYFTMQDGWAKLSTLGRVGTVIHEARHTAGYRHISCQQGPYAGASLPGCDSTYEYGGSHGIEMEYYARVVVLGNNFHPLYKKMARLMALGRSNFVFNKQVIVGREALLLTERHKTTAVLLAGNDVLERELPGSGTLKRTSFGASLFNGTRGFALDLYNNWGSADAVQDDFSYFKLLMGADGLPAGSKLVDFEEIDISNKRFVVAINENNQISTYNFPNGGWNSFATLNFKPTAIRTKVLKGNVGVYLLDAAQNTYKYDPSTRRVVTQLAAWPMDVAKVISSPQGEELALLNNGQLIKTADSSIYMAGDFKEAVNIPLYDAFDVQK